jgi:potassium-dependent mechanosensitive channel
MNRPARHLAARRACRLLALALALGSLSGPATAQLLPGLGGTTSPRTEQAEADAAKPEAKAEPAAIALERIPEQLERSRELARRATEAARPTADVTAIREQMAALPERLAWLAEPAAQRLVARHDLRSLEGAQELVTATRRGVTAWQATLGRRASELAGWRDEVSHQRRSWALTEESLKDDAPPAEIRNGVRNIQATLRDAARALGERQEDLLGLQGTLADWLAAIDERRALLDVELAKARMELFRPDQPPLWRGLASPLAGEDLAASREVWLRDWQTVRGLPAGPAGQRMGPPGAAGFPAGAPSPPWPARCVPGPRTSRISSRPLAVFHHPLAAALVLAILSGPWLYPDAPAALRELFGRAADPAAAAGAAAGRHAIAARRALPAGRPVPADAAPRAAWAPGRRWSAPGCCCSPRPRSPSPSRGSSGPAGPAAKLEAGPLVDRGAPGGAPQPYRAGRLLLANAVGLVSLSGC